MHLLGKIRLFLDFSPIKSGSVRVLRELACLKTAPAF